MTPSLSPSSPAKDRIPQAKGVHEVQRESWSRWLHDDDDADTSESRIIPHCGEDP